MAHFEAVASAAPQLDIYLYENRDRAGYTLSLTLISELRRRVPTICWTEGNGRPAGAGPCVPGATR